MVARRLLAIISASAVAVSLAAVSLPRPAVAASTAAAEAYEQARRSYYAVKADKGRQRYRHHWLKAIARFNEVAQRYPHSSEAPRALFTAAGLWADLHRVSQRGSDLDQAIAAYERLVARHADSSLADDALWQIATLQLTRRSDREAAKKAVHRLLSQYPRSDQAADGRALARKLGSGDQRGGDAEARATARSTPTSRSRKTREAPPAAAPLRPSSDAHGATASAAAPSERPSDTPPDRSSAGSSDRSSERSSARPDSVAAAAPDARPADPATPDDQDALLIGRREDSGPKPQVTDVKIWGNSAYGRIVLYTTSAVQVRMVGDEGDGTARAARAIDVVGAHLSPTVAAAYEQPTALLRSVRLRAEADDVRLSLTLAAAAHPRAMVLENPYRIVIDATTDADGRDGSGRAATLDRPLRIVLDPGHGGHDGGAKAKGGLREKDVTLAIAKKVEELLTARGLEVILTRADDRFVSLEERTAIANRAAADAFVSIHANSARRAKASGIETYFLDTTDDRYALRLAARENSTQEEQVSDIQLILADLATKLSTRDSQELARAVQSRVVAAARVAGGKCKNLGVKSSLFYVLLGARMPAVLVETGFLSNEREARLLADAGYRSQMGRAIAEGIVTQLERPLVASQLSADP